MTLAQHTLGSAELAATKAELPLARGSMLSHDAFGMLSHDAFGLWIMTLLPAVFWPSLMALAGVLAGSPFALTTLLLTGAAIAGFLGLVCSALLKQGTLMQQAVRPSSQH